MQKEYGCNELMMDGGYCTSIGDVVCLCDECQRKIIEKIELLEGVKNTEQPLQTDNGYVCNRPGQCAKGQGGKCYSGFDCPDKAIAG